MNVVPRKFAILLTLLLLLSCCAVVSADVPLLPAEFYGNVSLNGNPAPAGSLITATINGTLRGSLTTSAAGMYGGPGIMEIRLNVSGQDGDLDQPIVFRVNGVPANESPLYSQGSVTRLNLTAVSVTLNFQGTPASGQYPLTVQFTDVTPVKAPTKWNWSFGDGQVFSTTLVTQKNVSHTYTNPGIYSVGLTITNATTSYSLVRPGYIQVKATPVAGFTANATYGITPMVVQFTDTSANSPTAWNWSFGDNTYAVEQNPVHLYTITGNYTVSLNATNADGSNTLIRNSYINVAPVPSTLAIRNIPVGGTVYIGESGLNITQCVVGAHSLAWFQPGLDPSADIPNATVFFTGEDTSFFVSPANFAARPGTWYNWNPGQTLGTSPIAFNVTDPAIDITVTDTTSGTDADGRTIPVGDQISFNLSTNMGTLAERGIEGTPIRIIIISPSGTSYTTLSNSSGSITPLSFNVPASEYSTGPIWNTANSLYPAGKYNITARYNVNGMADNYPAAGKTISVYRTVNTSTSMPRPVQPFPVIKTVTPASANQNSTISFTLTGTDFQPGGTTVEFRNAVSAALITPTLGTVTATRIDGTLQIPDNSTAGTWLIRVVTDGGENTLVGKFTVVQPPRPVITTMTPTTGVRTSIVSFTMAGTNFQPGFGNTTVTLFNQSYNSMNNANVTATLTSVTPTAITGTFMVPEDSPFGNAWRVNVTTLSGGRSTTPITFSVPQQLTPAITSITPATALQNSTVEVTLAGTNFQIGTDGSNVTLYNQTYFGATGENLSVKITSVTPTTIKGQLTIPKAAPEGDRWIVNVTTVDGGTSTSLVRFTVVRPVPAITTMTPTSGVRTSVVTFTMAGTNFRPGFGNTTVTLFNQTYFTAHSQNLTATLTSVTATAITGNFTVPVDSPFGNAWVVNVTTLDGGMSMSPVIFAVPRQLTPTITSVTPASGILNSTFEVTLAGTNFQVGNGGSNVTFYNKTYFDATSEYLVLKITSVTPTMIKGKLTIPKTAPAGDGWFVNVTTVDGGNNTVPLRFPVVKPVPAITTMTPTIGVRTSIVAFTLTGTNFQPGIGNTTVTMFNQSYFTAHTHNVTATILSVTPTTIIGNVSVPADSPFGNAWVVNVTTADGGMSMSPITFAVPKQLTPTITAITPASGNLNSTVDVTLTGTNFQIGIGGSNVTFTNTSYFQSTGEYLALKVTSVTPTTITGKLTIPKTAPFGDRWYVNVTTVDGGNNTVPGRFTVVKPVPTITTMTPATGVRTSIVSFTLAGTNFQPGTGNTTVTLFNRTYFDTYNQNLTANLTSLTPTSITGNFTVPEDSPFGNAWVVNVTTADGGMSMSPVTFAVPQLFMPTVTSITPATAFQNSTVDVSIAGTNFQIGNGGSNVTLFNQTYFDSTGENLSVRITSVTPTLIKGKLTIPNTAPEGDRWTVNATTVDHGTSMSLVRFTVVKPVPTITSMTPTSGVRTNIISFTLAGTNFQPGTGNTTVTLFNRSYYYVHWHDLVANITSVTPTSITGNFTVPEDSPFGNAWVVNVTTADGGKSMSRIFFEVPKQPTATITSITPASGFQNRTVDVTLAGTSFQTGIAGSNVTLYNRTYFDATGENMSVKITSVTPTLIKGKLTIPNTAPEGDRWTVNVTTVDGGTSMSLVRFLVIKPVPTITSITPSSGMRMQQITFTLAGTNFQTGVGNTTVTIYNKTYFEAHNHNVTVNLTSVTPTAITGNFTVPADDPFGMFWAVTVRTADGGTSPSGIIFTETRLNPTFRSMIPNAGYQNSTVEFRIEGSNFQKGLTTVNFSHPSYGELPATLRYSGLGLIEGAVTLPGTPLGAWKVNITTADGARVSTTFTVNKLPAPVIKDYYPAVMYQSDTPPISIIGDYFETDDRSIVVLSRPGQPEIRANLQLVYHNTLFGNVTIPAGTAPGLWNLNVTTVDGGTTSKIGAITIVR